MKCEKRTKSFGLKGNHSIMKKRNENGCFSGRYFSNTHFLLLIAVGLALFSVTESANAQFVVQPGIVQINNIAPRQVFPQTLSIHNFDPNQSIDVELKVIELTQKPDGTWLPFSLDPCSPFDYYPGLDVSNVSSCRDWVKLDKEIVNIPQDGDVQVGMHLRSPSRLGTGFYGAAIIASTKVRGSDSDKVPMVIRTGIPVIAIRNRQNTPADVNLCGVNLEFVPSQGLTQGRVFATMRIKNAGTTFPPLRPILRISGWFDNHWRLITTHEFENVGIIPGVELNLKSDLGKSLPSGKYRLDGALYADGTLKGKNRRFGREIQFEGDPFLNRPASDVPLDLTPKDVTIETTSGSDRYGYLDIHNAADEEIYVEPILDIPETFKGKAKDNIIISDAMTCLKWLSFSESKFKLEGFKDKTLKITAGVPSNATPLPYYYAALGLKVTYPDGQSAGTTWTNICLKNKNVVPQTQVNCSSINLVEVDKSKSLYLIQAWFDNNGNSHVDPERVRAAVVKADGFSRTAAMLSSKNYGMFLPLETRLYTGTLNFAPVAEGDYNLEVLMNYPPDQKASLQIRVQVTAAGDQRIPKITQTNKNSTELVPVQW